jgi:hypothetical protein
MKMDKKIVLINGSGGTDKDAFIGFCNNFVEVENISTVDKVKEAATIFGWDGGKTEKDKLFLSNLKLVWDKYNGGSNAYAADKICDFIRGPKKLLFIHCREPKNIVLITSMFECETLLIKTIRVDAISSNMTDANVDNYEYDHVIHNDSDLEHLKRAAALFIDHLFPSRKNMPSNER